MKLKHDKLIMDGTEGLDIKNAVRVVRICYEISPSFFGDERPASHELSHCSWIGAAKPVAWLHFKPPIIVKLQKLSPSRTKPSSGNTSNQAHVYI